MQCLKMAVDNNQETRQQGDYALAAAIDKHVLQTHN